MILRRAISVFVPALLVAPTAFASTPAHLWSGGYGGTSTDRVEAAVIAPGGDVIVCGYFQDTIDLGGGPLVSAGGYDGFLARFNPAGELLWNRSFGDASSDYAIGVQLDGDGNIVLAGYFSGSIDLGGGVLTSAGSTDPYVARFTPGGTHLWSQNFGGSSADYCSGLAVDGDGNAVVTGYFAGTAAFGGGNFVSAGGFDIWVAKYDADGAHLWSQAYGSTGDDSGDDVAADSDGNVLLVGLFEGAVSVGGGSLVSNGGTDTFVAQYNAAGSHGWSLSYGSPTNELIGTLAVDGGNNVVVTGSVLGTVDFGGGNLVSAGIFDAYLASYDAAGAHRWSRLLGGGSNDFGFGVAARNDGTVIASGSFAGTVDFGGGNLVSAGVSDIYLASFDDSGIHRWSRGAGGVAADAGLHVGTGTGGDVIAVGYFGDGADFGGGTLYSAGDTDGFVARYADGPSEPAIASIEDIGNDQGRKVKIRFDRSQVDDPAAAAPVTEYLAFRRDDPAPSGAAVRPGMGPMSAPGWTQVGSVSAFAEESYGIDVATVADSTVSAGQYYSVFYIRAATALPSRFFDSSPDSGYSLDNLAPSAPANLAYNAGQLSWSGSSAPDFDFFTVYGSHSNDFGAAEVVDYTVVTMLDVAASPYPFYFVTATDFSGNEGAPAGLETVTAAGGSPQRYVLSVGNYPNPFNPRTTVRYTVPSPGAVTITIHDARGTRVATLLDGEMRAAGPYRVEWNGRTRGGDSAASGVYFARIVHDGASRSKKMVLLK